MKPTRLLLLIFCLCPLAVYAQTAEVGGAVQDPSGAVIPRASVEFRNQDTGIRRQTITNANGYYHIDGVDPGKYDATVQAKGFKTLTRENIVFQVGDKSQIDFKMQVGPQSQSIVVDGSGTQINTTDASVSTVIDRRFVENIPLNGRSFQDLILLTPGVVTQSPQSGTVLGQGGDFSVNGQRTESNYYLVDGISGNTSAGSGGAPTAAQSGTVAASTAVGTTQSLVSVDALQEFRVDSSTYSAEYGRSPGGQFSFLTRSGTDAFHGTLYDYLRNDYFDANDWFSDYFKTPQPALRQNDFGGTLGGPIAIPRLYEGKGKSFFFFSYEGLRLSQPQVASLQYVPTLLFRQQAPAALQGILNAFPIPTPGGTDYGNGLADFIQSDSLPSRIDSISVRLDHTISSKLHLFFRFSDTPSSAAARQLSVYEPSNFGSQTYTLGATAQLGEHLSEEFRGGYVGSHSASLGTIDTFGGAQPTNIAAALGAGSSATSGGIFDLLFGAEKTSLASSPASNALRQWNFTDTVSWQHGKHQIKAGVDYRFFNSPFSPTTPFADYLYINQSEVLSNKALLGEGVVSLSATPTYRQFAAFGQDEWRPIERLTLSLGLRWEVAPPPGAKEGNLPYILQGNINDPATLSLAPKGTPLWKTAWYNFAPRLGAAWIANAAPGRQTVVRGGGGVFFDAGAPNANFGYQGVGFSATNLVFGAAAPFPGGMTFIPTVNPPYGLVAYTYPHLQLPYTLEWNAAVEQQLGNAQTLSATYLGANGRRLLALHEYSIAAQNPNFSEVTQYGNSSTSNYQALQLKFQRTVTRGFQALASYTWSHSIDYESNASVLPLKRGNSDFDVRHSFSAGGTWQIPNVKRNVVAKTAFNDWALDGHFIVRTGFPVNIDGNQLTDPATGNTYFGGVNIVPNEPFYLYGATCTAAYNNGKACPGGRAINPAAFIAPSSGTQIGNAPRNFLRGFGANQVNLAARREFHLSKDIALQFRAEAFNILNHPNFGFIDSTLSDQTFGQATKTLSQSLTTVSPLYQMGGPRSMQFALKLQF